MTNVFSHYKRGLQASTRTPAARVKYGRMSISGKEILDENGVPFVPRGFNQGHGELTIDSDPAEDVSMGANTVRIIWRVWGFYGNENGVIQDGQDLNGPGNFKRDYLESIVHRVKLAKAAGLKVDLCGDSNCGQGVVDSPEYCTIDGSPNQNFWTEKGKVQRKAFLKAWKWMARRLHGLVDFYEPIVEPLAVEASKELCWKFQTEIRNTILGEDPAALFIMGAWPAYQMQQIAEAMNPAWASENNTIITANILSGLVANSATIGDKVQLAIDARELHNVPCMIQQIGSTTADDPDDSLLDHALTLLDEAAGGSIGYTIWEKTAIYANSYGMYTQADVGAPRYLKPLRQEMLERHFRGIVVPTEFTWSNQGYLAINANPIEDYNASAIYRNLARAPRSFSANSYDETDVTLKTTGSDKGYPVDGTSFGAVFLTELQSSHNGIYKLSVKGNNPFLQAGSGSLSASTYNGITNKTTATLTLTNVDNTDLIALRWTNVVGFGELEVMQPGYEPGDNVPYTTEAALHYATWQGQEIRCMDRMRINATNDQEWAGSVASLYDTPLGFAHSLRASIDMCNHLSASPWLNVTAQSSYNYKRTFIDQAVTYTAPDKPITIEYGNEVWNYGFQAYWDIMNKTMVDAKLAYGFTDSRLTVNRRIVSVVRTGTTVVITLSWQHNLTVGAQIYDHSDSSEAIAPGLRTLTAVGNFTLTFTHPDSGNTTGVVDTGWYNSYLYLDPSLEVCQPVESIGIAAWEKYTDPQGIKTKMEMLQLREIYSAAAELDVLDRIAIVKGVQLSGGIGWYYERHGLIFAMDKWGSLDWLFNNGGGLRPAYYVRPDEGDDNNLTTEDAVFAEAEQNRVAIKAELMKWVTMLRAFGQTKIAAYEGGPHHDRKPTTTIAQAVRDAHRDDRMRVLIKTMYQDWSDCSGTSFAYFHAGATRTYLGVSFGSTNNNTWALIEGTLASAIQPKYQAQTELAAEAYAPAPIAGLTSGTIPFRDTQNSWFANYNPGGNQLAISPSTNAPDVGVVVTVEEAGAYTIAVDAGAATSGSDQITLYVNGEAQGATVNLPNWSGDATPPGQALSRTVNLNAGTNFVQVRLSAAPRSDNVSLYRVRVS